MGEVEGNPSERQRLMPNRKILIVDDDRDLRMGLMILLRANGYDVAVAPDGITAIIEAQRSKPDAVILDIGLPGGDGFMVLERFRSIVPLSAIPIVILSAMDPAKNKLRALSAGAVDYLQKPADNRQLLAALQRALGGSPDSATPAQSPAERDKETARKTILIVDDDPDVLRSLSVRLKASGYNTVAAGDAVSAITKVRKESPDLILLDIAMPGGDGYVVIDRLKTLWPDKRIPIIAISAKDPAEHREKILQAGARAFFQKPLDNHALLSEISKVLQKK